MRSSSLTLGCMLTAAAVVGCKRPEPGASAPPIESTRSDAATAARPRIEIREGKPIDLGIRLGLRDFAEAGDGGFVALDQTGAGDLIVRRLAPDLRTAWEVTIVGERRRIVSIGRSAVVVAGASVWVAFTFEGAISYSGRRAVAVDEMYDSSPDLLFLRLDLASGKLVAEKQYGELASLGGVRLGTDGNVVYAAVAYTDPIDGKPGWGPPAVPRRSGYRFVRLQDDGSTRWIVDTSANKSGVYDAIRASSCCVLVGGQTTLAFEIGGVHVARDEALYTPSKWAAVLSANDGRVLDARILNVAKPIGDAQEGGDGLATLDGEAIHYALEGSWFSASTGVIAFWQLASKSHLRMPLECGHRGCAPLTLELIGDHLLIVLAGAGKIEARLYTKTGEVVAESHFVPESEGKTIHVERQPDGVTVYLAAWDETTPTPISVRVTDSAVH